MLNLNDTLVATETLVLPTLDDCKKALFEKYGNNFRILDQETVFVRGGFLNLFSRPAKKVTYIREPATYEVQEPASRMASTVASAPASSVTNEKFEAMNDKIDELSRKMSIFASAVVQPEKHETIKRIETLLQENEFTPSYIETISNRLRSEFAAAELDDFDAVEHRVVDWIGQSINIAQESYFKAPHVIVIVGPTGVGKTTTVAKMAAGIILEARNAGKPEPMVRMVTIDTTRVGAEEQLRRYGEIMDIQVDKAENPQTVGEIFSQYKESMDTLLVDTSGYSPNDYDNIAKMRKFLDVPGLHPDVYLAVSASTKARDLENIMQNYEMFNFRSVIITKCDETTRYGNILSVLAEKNKSISYITDGQQVPRYFEKATVVRFLTNLADFNIDRSHIDEIFRS